MDISKGELIVPIVHLNGTSADELKEQLQFAYSSLWDAVEALKRSAPNGRDYYPQPGLLEKAELQHRRRIMTLHSMQQELEDQMDGIDAQTNR